MLEGPNCEREFRSKESHTIYRGAFSNGAHGEGQLQIKKRDGKKVNILQVGTWIQGKLVKGYIDENGVQQPVIYFQGSSYLAKIVIPQLMSELVSLVAGQPVALNFILQPILRRWLGWTPPNRPLVLFFAGPSGVGKTKLAKALATLLDKLNPAVWESLSKNVSVAKTSLIRIDMSEYHDKYLVSRFIGAPPGYVGHNDGGQLTNALREQPKAVGMCIES